MSNDFDDSNDNDLNNLPFNFTMENSFLEWIPLPCELQKLVNKTLECEDLESEKTILAWFTSIIFVVVFPTVSFVTTMRSGKVSKGQIVRKV